MVLQGLGREPSGHMVQPGEIGSNGSQSRRDHLQRLVQRLGDLPQGRGPVALGLLWKLARSLDDHDGVGEGGLDQDWGLAHWDQQPWRLGWMGMDVSIFYVILGIRQCSTDYQYL